MTRLRVDSESWPIRGTFTISRGSKTSAEVVLVEITKGQHTGRGECVPYARYGESIASVIDQIESVRALVEDGVDSVSIQSALPAGAARNAVDCALWDLQAKRASQRVWSLAGIPVPQPVVTAYTLSLDEPKAMQEAAQIHAKRPLLKLKLAGDGDLDRVAAVRAGAPQSTIIVDANEGWTIDQYLTMVPQLASLGVALIEQPLPAGGDAALAEVERPIPLCADESCHDTSTLDQLTGRYDTINIKLDKTGGLTEALALRQSALSLGFEVMVGCMVSTSLAMAPATLLTAGAGIVDLDGPLILAKDRSHPLDYQNFSISPPTAELWG